MPLVANIADCMILSLFQLKGHFTNRPIVLLGWSIGALIACHVSYTVKVQDSTSNTTSIQQLLLSIMEDCRNVRKKQNKIDFIDFHEV